MDVKTFKQIAPKLPPEIAILLRGPTGIGKSHLGQQLADELKLPFIDVRGSTMSEGDVGGYPDIEGMKESGIMTFCMPSWFVRSCKEPVVICLDELNRSLPGVQQSFFQLILDRELGNDTNGTPYRLHPSTRVIACVNHGAEYDVNDMDPALLRRFWVCDIEPNVGDWIDWARDNGVDSILIDFIRQNTMHFSVDTSSIEQGTVCPNPASWHRVSTSLEFMGMSPVDWAGNQRPEGFYALCSGMVGKEASISFTDFVEKYEMIVSANDILDNYSNDDVLNKVSAMTNDRVIALIDKIKIDCLENEWKLSQAKNVAKFANDIPDEMTVSLWNNIVASKKLPNIQKMHKLIGQKVVEIVQSSREFND